MGNEHLVVPGQTTLSGRYTAPAGITFDSIQDANDAEMNVISKNANGDPTRIEWHANSKSKIYKAVQILVYDVDGDLQTTHNSIEAR